MTKQQVVYTEDVIKNKIPFETYPTRMFQVLEKPFDYATNESAVKEMAQKNLFMPLDYDIAKFVFQNRFVTEKQLILTAKILAKKLKKEKPHLKNIGGLTETSLKRLTETRILNRFVLSKTNENTEKNIKYYEELVEKEKDIQVIYCLDLAGKYLIESYFDDERILSWKVSDNYTDSSKIGKHLVMTQLALRIMVDKHVEVKTMYPDVTLYRKRIPIRFENEITLKNDKVFLVKYFTQNDILNKRNFIDEIVIEFLMTNAWKKYYTNQPTLAFVVDSQKTAVNIIKLMEAVIKEHRECEDIKTYYDVSYVFSTPNLITSGKSFRFDRTRNKLIPLKTPLII